MGIAGRMIVAAAVLAAIPAGATVAQDIVVGGRYQQSAPVRARYGDLPVRIETPALLLGRTTLTSQAEMQRFIGALVGRNSPLAVRTLMTTPQGRQMPLLYLTQEGLADPAAIRSTGRAVVWLIGQQHGNEPAGGEAMLALTGMLATGELRPLLEHLAVVIVPRANPDGAAADLRDTALKMDMNRDHGTLTLPEVKALHAAAQELPPDLVVDAHEFAVAARWIEKFGGLQAADLMHLSATHPAVPAATRRFAAEVFAPVIEAAMAAHGLKTFPYHTTTTRRDDRSIAIGGNAPGIARNAFGLAGAVSLLLESRGVGIGMEGYQRRVATHVIAISAILKAAAANRVALKGTVASARAEIARATGDIIVRHHLQQLPVALPLMDPETGADKLATVTMTDSRQATVTLARPRPAGYLLLEDSGNGTRDWLRLVGAATCVVRRETMLEAEAFVVMERAGSNRRAINPEAGLRAVVRRERVLAPAGAVYVPIAQAAGERIAAALEADAPGSLIASEVMRMPAGSAVAPVYRIPHGAALDLTVSDGSDPAFCRRP